MKKDTLQSKLFLFIYFIFFFSLFLYSFTQIDLGLVISRNQFFYHIENVFQHIGYFNRPLSTYIYLAIILGLSILYITALRLAIKGKLKKHFIWKIIIIGIILLTFSYNAFSYDLFNYIFDAKIITHYHANPYLHKALDYPGDPMLAFMHWTHRVYPYGPVWLFLTVPLSFLGFQLFLPTFFLFKLLMTASYSGTLYYIGKIFKKLWPEREVYGLVFFGLNPLVLVESLVSAHIDIVMMFFSILAFWLLIERKYMLSYGSMLFSVGVKFLTGLLMPFFVLLHILEVKKKKIVWAKMIGGGLLLLIIGIIAETQQSGNFQPWYLLAFLSFAVFLSEKYYILIPSVIISAASLLLYVPYLFLGNWNPPVPQILSAIMVASYITSFFSIIVYYFYKKLFIGHHS